MSVASRAYALGSLAQVPDPGSRGFDIDTGDERPLRVFVVHKNGAISAFYNRCPHTGAPLEWQPHQFLDIENSFIQCAIHGALFRPEDGYCLRGPCAGQVLQQIMVRVDDAGQLVAELPVHPGASVPDQ